MRPPTPKGFTLVELMIVIAVVAILAAIAGPSFRHLIAQQRVKNASSALTESVWFARSEALKRNADVSFTFNTAGWTVTLVSDADTPLMSQDGFAAVSADLKSGTGVFRFNALGRLASVHTIELRSGGSSGPVRCVRVATSGKTTVKDNAC